MPIDVCKTVYQVYGDGALQQLLVRRRTSGMRGFYFGSAAAFTTSFAGLISQLFTQALYILDLLHRSSALVHHF